MKTTVASKGSPNQRAPMPSADMLGGGGLADPLGRTILRKESGAPAIASHGAFSAATKGGGGPVPYKSEMEQSFGADFSAVKAFTGRSKEAGMMGAEAATKGESIVFADASPSRETVGHELGHVQQFRGGTAPTGGQGGFGNPGSGAEREADAAGAAAAKGETAHAGGAPAQGIHFRFKPGNRAVTVPDVINESDFKTKTDVMFATRGANLKAIDNWLAALDKYTLASEAPKFDHALEQCLAAAEHWLAEHAVEADRNRSVKARYPHVEALAAALNGVKLGGAPVPVVVSPAPQQPAKQEDGPSGANVAKAVTETVPAGTGLVGMGGDIHGEDNQYGKLGKPGKHDAAEGGFMAAGGVTDILLGVGQFNQKDENGQTSRYNQAMGSAGVATGVSKIGGGIAKSVAGASGGENVTAMKTSEGFGAAGAMLSGVTETAGFIKGIKDAADDTKDPAFSADQKVAFTADRARNLVNISKATSDTVNALTKATTGAANAGAATASGAAGVVTGSIDILQGGYQVITALSDKSKLDAQTKNIDDTLQSLKDEKTQAERDKGVELASNVGKSSATKARIAAKWDAVIEKLDKAIQELTAKRVEFDEAIAGMHKVQDRRMKSGAFKMATGTLDVISGALVLSGIGAPVAIALAAFSSLLKLGSVALDVGRSWKTSKMTEIALRLDDAGNVKGKPDAPDQVGYRTMEKRVQAAYYNSYVNSFHDKTPPDGMSSDDWSHVRDFVHEEKLSRVKPESKESMDMATAKGKGQADMNDKWGEITGAGGKILETEYPSRARRANLTFTFSAHKSKQAIDASNGELAEALVKIGMSAFDPNTKGFVSTVVHPMGGGGEGGKTEQGREMQKAMADTMLSQVGITPEIWVKMWQGAGGHFAGDANKADPTHPYLTHAAPDWAKFTGFVKGKVDAT